MEKHLSQRALRQSKMAKNEHARIAQARAEGFAAGATWMREQAKQAVQHGCTVCNGSGVAEYAGYPEEEEMQCEYCGRPMAIIEALATEKRDG